MLEVTFPNPKHSISAGFHISILALIELHAALLACVGVGKPDWVAVPVISVKLDDKPRFGNESIDAELAANQELALVRDAQTVEKRIPSPL